MTSSPSRPPTTTHRPPRRLERRSWAQKKAPARPKEKEEEEGRRERRYRLGSPTARRNHGNRDAAGSRESGRRSALSGAESGGRSGPSQALHRPCAAAAAAGVTPPPPWSLRWAGLLRRERGCLLAGQSVTQAVGFPPLLDHHQHQARKPIHNPPPRLHRQLTAKRGVPPRLAFLRAQFLNMVMMRIATTVQY